MSFFLLAAAPVGVITHHNAIKAHDARMGGANSGDPAHEGVAKLGLPKRPLTPPITFLKENG